MIAGRGEKGYKIGRDLTRTDASFKWAFLSILGSLELPLAHPDLDDLDLTSTVVGSSSWAGRPTD